MKRQTWLRPNRRALAINALILTPLLGLGCVLLRWPTRVPAGGMLGWGIMALILAVWGLLAWLALVPRVARAGDELLLYLDGLRPIRLPLGVVECFFHGQAPLEISARGGKSGDLVPLESLNIIVRIAERAEAWQSHEVSHSLGKWCGGYVTILGTTCEPLSPELMRRLNEQLIQAHREIRQRTDGKSGDSANGAKAISPVDRASPVETMSPTNTNP